MGKAIIVGRFLTAKISLFLGLVSLSILLWLGLQSVSFTENSASTDPAISRVDQADQPRPRPDFGPGKKEPDRQLHPAFSAGLPGTDWESASPLRRGPKRTGPPPVVSDTRGLIDEVHMSEDPDTKIRAIRKLAGSVRVTEVRQALIEALNDPHEAVRMAALNLLPATNDPAVPYILGELERSDPSPAVRESAAALLQYISTPADQASGGTNPQR